MFGLKPGIGSVRSYENLCKRAVGIKSFMFLSFSAWAAGIVVPLPLPPRTRCTATGPTS